VSGPIAIAVAISTASLGWAAAVEFGLCALLVTLVLVSVVNQIVDRRRQAAGAAMVSLALALLAGELAAGASPASALSAASEAGVDIGARIDGPVGPDDHVARVVVAWQFSAETGVALADLVGRVRADLADAVAGRRDLSTVAAGPQASAAVLAALPVLGVALGAAMGADPLGVLFGTPAGRLLLCLGVALDAAGVAWTMRLVARARR
jgi:tight adherence protein B